MAQKETNYLKTTLVFPQNAEGILLGMKKRGFGEGWWNGFGGKLLDGEDYENAAKRETHEEAGITVDSLLHVANLHFYFDSVLSVVSRAYIAAFTGKPEETEEMRPQFFMADQLPYHQMWPADRLWIPKAFSIKKDLPLGFIIRFDGSKSFESIEEVAARQLENFL
jgi:8-oxo-dGTP pyrophosphatase MutT (NUDIX family)